MDANFLEEAAATAGEQGRVAMAYRIKDRGQAITFPRMFRLGVS